MPRAETTLVVVLGAGTFEDEDMNCDAFAHSAEMLNRYFTSPSGYGAPEKNVCFDLFDSPMAPGEIVRSLVTFIAKRSDELRAAGTPAEDIILYYVGHGNRSD